jgi:hypothetical protein
MMKRGVVGVWLGIYGSHQKVQKGQNPKFIELKSEPITIDE